MLTFIHAFAILIESQQPPCEIDTINNPFSQMRKLRLKSYKTAYPGSYSS